MKWDYAQVVEIPEIIQLVVDSYQTDGQDIWTIDTVEGSRNLMLAMVNQMYAPASELIITCRDDQNRLLAFTWCQRNARQPWSTEEHAVAKMLSVDLTLPVRDRIIICEQAMTHWEHWARTNNIPILMSNSLREDNRGFMRLHQRQGYTVRNNMAWKRL